MREIAKRAGYTPGALYSYFASREEIYAALLGESLLRLNAQVAGAPDGGNAADRVRSKASAFFDFYRDNPRDLDLGFYLFQGVRPSGLSRELDAQLNALDGNDRGTVLANLAISHVRACEKLLTDDSFDELIACLEDDDEEVLH